ncbi:spore germination protein KC [Paenibacillus sacheonensis]|nr:spore germination protein KC [Paenibacillus sacheonensis]
MLLCVLLMVTPCVSGCSDFVEPNQLAFVIGTAVDQVQDGSIEVSLQVVIPSQLQKGNSTNSESFIVISAKGRDVFEASQNIQRKIPRRLMTSHRILIAIGESYFQKNELNLLFDKLARDPSNTLRDVVILIKGGRAKDFLRLKHPMEYVTSLAASKEMNINGLQDFTSRQLVIDSLSQGTRPLVPVFKVEHKTVSSQKKSEGIPVFAGFAVLNKKLKPVGFLNDTECAGASWLAGKGMFQGITMPWKNGKGMLSFRLSRLDRSIRSVRGQDPKQVVLAIKAQAYLLENTASLDMTDMNTVIDVQKYMNAYIRKDLQATVNKVQKSGSDVFGIGEYLHRKHPIWWKRQRDEWDANFKTVQVTVKSDIQLRSVGVIGGELK